jgi:TonB family protein
MILSAALLLASLQTQAAPPQAAPLSAAPANAPIQDEPLTVPAIVYPAEARKARIQGAVGLQINVDATGHVTKVEALSGPIPLRQAAVDAYSQATYRPILVAGRPAPAVITTSVNFSLKELPPDTDQQLDARFKPLQANCQELEHEHSPDALEACRKALDAASRFSPDFELEAHATAFNDVVLILIADGKKSTNLGEAGLLADQAIDLVSQVAHDSPHRPAVAVAYITRCEVRSLAGDLKGAAKDCANAEETLTTLLHDYPENERAGNYRVQLRETLQLHSVIADRDHHPSEARRLKDRADTI